MSNAKNIAESLGVHKCSSEGWFLCKCPIHEDNKPSLSIKDGDNGSVIFNCFAGCESKDIADYFKSKGFAVHRETALQAAQQIRRKVCTYSYIDEHGELLYEKIRFDPKQFLITNPVTGSGINGHKHALYGRNKLVGLKKGDIVYITEGEKDVDFLNSLGFIAVTSGGATTWSETNNKLFDGFVVRIIPDNDKPGTKLANRIKDELTGIAAKVVIGNVPEKYKDVSDWNCKKEDVLSLFDKINFKTISFNDLLNLKINDSWIIKDYIVENSICQIFGASGSGKSFFALDMAYCVAGGIDFFDKKVKKGKVLYIAGEGFVGIKKRAKALQDKYNGEIADGFFEVSIQAAELLSASSCIDVAEKIESNDGFDLVIIDTLNRNMGNGDENSTQDMTQFINNIDSYIKSLGCAVIIVHHTGLANPDRARGSGSVYNALDTEFKVEKEENNLITVTCTKQKEGESMWSNDFMLTPVKVGLDDDKNDIYSCVINKHIELNISPKAGRNASVLDGIRKACIEDGDERIEANKKIYVVTEDQWRECAYLRLGSRKNKRRDFSLAKAELIKQGSVNVYDGYYYTDISVN